MAIVGDLPFVLSLSKHENAFFSTLLEAKPVNRTDPGPSPEPKLGNVWWLLAILSAAVGVTALVLEGLGVLQDLGLSLTGISLFAPMLFGLAASTRNYD